MRVTLLTNGPGELWGWVRPVAAELRRRGHSVSLWLLPCPFASGHEREAASLLGVDKLEGPSGGAGLWRAMAEERTDCVVQLGGDLIFGRRIAKSSGAPLFCYTYGRKKGLDCAGVFTAFPQQALNIPGAVPIGDLVKDALAMDGQSAAWPESDAPGRSPRVLFLPGSRGAIRTAALPWLAAVLTELRRKIPAVRVMTLFAPFVPDAEVAPWRAAGLNPVRTGAGAVMRSADFALTQPGTNNFELMHCGVPSLVVGPASFLELVPVSGLFGVVSGLPIIGRKIRRHAVRRIIDRWGGVISLPNRLTNRRIMDEMWGDVTPDDAAARIIQSLADEDGLARSRRELLEMSGDEGAASRLCDALPLSSLNGQM